MFFPVCILHNLEKLELPFYRHLVVTIIGQCVNTLKNSRHKHPDFLRPANFLFTECNYNISFFTLGTFKVPAA